MTRAMSLSTKLSWGALALIVAVVGAALVWVPFPTELASTCYLVAVPVVPSVFLYLALNRFGRLKRYRYVGFFFPVLCVLTYVVVVYLLNRGRPDPDGGMDILEFLSEIYAIEVCIAFLCLAGGEIRRRRKSTKARTTSSKRLG
jgi:hypothetical protein